MFKSSSYCTFGTKPPGSNDETSPARPPKTVPSNPPCAPCWPATVFFLKCWRVLANLTRRGRIYDQITIIHHHQQEASPTSRPRRTAADGGWGGFPKHVWVGFLRRRAGWARWSARRSVKCESVAGTAIWLIRRIVLRSTFLADQRLRGGVERRTRPGPAPARLGLGSVSARAQLRWLGRGLGPCKVGLSGERARSG